jgi:cytochrome c-type biogenesis protein CcmH/NrfG
MFMSFVLALLFASPQAQPASLDRAQALVKQEQWAHAEAELRRILASDEKHSAAWLLLGQSLYRQKRYDDALTAFERAGAAGAPKGWCSTTSPACTR